MILYSGLESRDVQNCGKKLRLHSTPTSAGNHVELFMSRKELEYISTVVEPNISCCLILHIKPVRFYAMDVENSIFYILLRI